MALGAVTSGLPNVDYAYRSSRQASAARTAFCPETEGTNDEEGRVIGLAMLPYGSSGMSYGMAARYAPESTESDPVVRQSAMAAWLKASEETDADVKTSEETDAEVKTAEETDAEVKTGEETAAAREAEEEAVDYLQVIQEYMDELFEKIQDGDTEPKFQLGGRAYTVREWNEILEQFDSALDAIREQIREQIEEQLERSKAASAKTEAAGLDMITADTVQARFPMQEVDDEGNPTEDIYLTAIDRDGIRCSKPGSDTYEWEIPFTEEGQYEKATAFMEWASEHMDNFLFAAHENFWQDLLGDKLDVTAFQEFLAGTNNGIPNYGITVGDSMYVDKSKVQWAKYMNHPGAKFYTAQEMAEMVAAEIEKNQAKLTKLSTPYGEIYRKYHPEYDGSAIFCEYPGGPLYTANEIGERMLERAMLEKDRSWSARRLLGLQ